MSRHNGPMGWFLRKKTTDELPAPELESLQAAIGMPVKALAVARGRGVLAAAMPEILGILRDGEWSFIGWHEIQHGGWDRDAGLLTWLSIDGQSTRVKLEDEGDLPEVFLERVGASIVMQQRLRVPETSFSVVIAARRALREGAPVVWTVQPLGTTSLDDARVRAFVLEVTEHLKDELNLA